MTPAQTRVIAHSLERVAWLMDRAFKIPGTRFRVGLDALLGVVPIGGDVLTGFIQAGLVVVALYHYKVPRSVAARMTANVLLDIAVGSIPFLGDLFDVAFKANTRNLRLLEPYQRQEEVLERQGAETTLGTMVPPPSSHALRTRSNGTPWRLILPIAVILLAALSLVVIGFVTVLRWLF